MPRLVLADRLSCTKAHTCRRAEEAQKSCRDLSDRHRRLQKAHEELRASHTALESHANLFSGFPALLETTPPAPWVPQATFAADLGASDDAPERLVRVAGPAEGTAAEVRGLRAVLPKPRGGASTAAPADAGELQPRLL
jgi:hypothetical protein